jgi:Sulfatase-modifying factor enzyme 1
VSGVSFHMGMLYSNWLHHDQSTDPSVLSNGAYDMSKIPPGAQPNQKLYPTHEPGAKFWIPTMDEWIKAAHYDPNKFGPGQAGWWEYRNSSDEPGIPGPPGVGTSSGGWEDPKKTGEEWNIPLGAYPNSQSPWGLLDTSGGTFEWTEEISNAYLPSSPERLLFGPAAGAFDLELFEWIGSAWSSVPQSFSPNNGLRIASAIPSPHGVMALAELFTMCMTIRTRRE